MDAGRGVTRLFPYIVSILLSTAPQTEFGQLANWKTAVFRSFLGTSWRHDNDDDDTRLRSKLSGSPTKVRRRFSEKTNAFELTNVDEEKTAEISIIIGRIVVCFRTISVGLR